MSSVSRVPQTRTMEGDELSADDARTTLRHYGSWRLVRDAFDSAARKKETSQKRVESTDEIWVRRNSVGPRPIESRSEFVDRRVGKR